jgi:uncharacterized protein
MWSGDFEYKDSILRVSSDKDIGDFVESFLVEKRQELEAYIAIDKEFASSFEPIALKEGAPEIANIMAGAAGRAGVGPMAAVAGTVSELLVREAVEKGASWIIAENGDDICFFGERNFTISIYAGKSPLSNKIGFLLNPGKRSYGVCTSSASVGHSISLGKADAVTVFAKSAAVADAFATAIANEVDEIEEGLEFARKFTDRDIDGAFIIKGDRIGSVGRLPKMLKID